MSTADELLASAFASDVLKVDLVNREIIIPDSVRHLGVTSDEDVMKILFEMPRFYGDIDLSDFNININYKNANGKGDSSPAKDIVAEVGTITFAWGIDRYVTAYAGNVEFSVCLENPDATESDGIGQALNTQSVTLPVLKGLNTKESVPEELPHLYRDLLERVKELEYKVANGNFGGGTQEYKISGKWILNSPVNLTGATAKCTISNANVKTGTAYNIIIHTIVAVDGLGVGYSFDELGESYVMVTDGYGVVSDDQYRYLDFGNGVVVPKEFYDWFMATAVQGSYSGSGTVEPDVPVTPTSYKITNNLTNCTNNNAYTTVAAGGSYVASILPQQGYSISNVTVTMGGTDVTSTVYSDGVISISVVTGDIVIVAAATETSGGGTSTEYSIEGKYLMNNTITLPFGSSVRSSEGNEGGMTGSGYGTRFEFMIALPQTGLFYHINGSNVKVAYDDDSDGEVTFPGTNGLYKLVDFAKQNVSAEFYEWLHANAVKQ